ncbi:MAG: PorP/SprF family type IX secretion system membrane protein [Bacteroidota bacterium]
MLRYNFLIIGFLFFLHSVNAQDPHFSFFSNNALAVNPALTGQINNYSSRIQLSHRRQWSTVLQDGAFETVFASYEKRLCLPVPNTYLGLGLSFLGDERGDFPLQRADAFGAASLITLLSKNSQSSLYLSVGVEGGWIFHQVGAEDLTFDEQFDDPNLPPEITSLGSSSEPDLGVGVALSFAKEERARGISGQIGITIKHLSKPPLSFFQLEDELTPILEQQYVYHGALSGQVSRNISIPFQAIYRVQQPHRQLLTSIGIQAAANDNWQLQFAGGLRLSRGPDGLQHDAVIPRVSVMHEKIQLTASYDVNTSNLRRASAAQGGLELQLAYNFGGGKCDVVFCPGL